MSASGESASSAREIKDRAAQWLERRDREDWSAADQAALDTWLNESLAHATAFWRIEEGWARTERLAALREPMRPVRANAPPRSSTLFRVIAAVSLAAVFGVLGTHYLSQPREKVYSTAIGGHEIITLADGSSIELNTDTSLRIAHNGTTRTVTLDKGEAYFQVTHDAAHPFVVNAGNHRVTDLGTKFLMRKGADRIEVAMYEGRASFEGTKDASSQSSILTPGDVAIGTSARGIQITKGVPAQILVNKLAWQRGFLVLDHTTLADAAQDLNRYNREKIVITDPAAGRMEMYGTIPINGVGGFVRVAQSVLGLRVEKHGNEILVSQ